MSNSSSGATLAEVISALPPSQRRAVERRAAELITEEMSIRELRKSLALTQMQLARELGRGQHEISRIEQRGDMLISTLTRLIEAMGGELQLVCRFKNRAPVRLVKPGRTGKNSSGRTGPRSRPKRAVR